ncbi:MAG: T9SS type A sorting domain-containing protein [Cytophagaceae bacterium]|nr:T9SS type A sorting domain-containing protein [Cytophagaceae bacterium]
MKKCLLLALFSFFLLIPAAYSQLTGPYTVPPKWMFGKQAGMSFPISGVGVPSVLLGNPSNESGQEASTTMTDTLGNVMLYSSNVRLYDGANGNVGGVLGGSSSTDGCVAFPDPAVNRISPTTGASGTYDRYYLFTGNDRTGGGGGATFTGINYYLVTKSGTTVTYSGATNIATGTDVDESITAGADGTGGYWVASKARGVNEFWVWHVTTAGVSAVSKQAANPWVGGTDNGTMKFNRCQTKVAFIGNNSVQVFNWDRIIGTIGTNIYSAVTPTLGLSLGYGLEFSPSGNMLYFSDLTGQKLYHLDLSTSTLTVLSSASSNNITEIGTMQLGIDGKIYVTNVSNLANPTYIGVISNPDGSAATCGYSSTGFTLNAGPGPYPTIYRGIANEPWLNPDLRINNSKVGGTCQYQFSHNFITYSRNIIGENTAAIRWDFTNDGTWDVTGNATPTYDYGGAGTYTVKLEVTDNTCNQTFQQTKQIVVPTCTAPVELISFIGIGNPSGADLLWKTAMELNNEYFDLQRSFDGINFISIAHIPGAGNSNNVLTYPYKDREVTSGLAYYRLIQHDKDGTQTSSKIIAVHFNKLSGAPVLIAPNPFSSSFVVSKIYAEEAAITVYDIYGRILEQQNTSAEETSISLGEGLANGSYIVQYLTVTNTYTVHVEKK